MGETIDISAARPAGFELSGKQVGEYQLVKQIGQGGMGFVYEAVHPVLGRKAAVKFLHAELSRDRPMVDRFVAEARAVCAIGHRGIVDVFAFGELEGMQYFVMEYLVGRSLDRLLATDGAQPAGRVVSWLEQVLDALGAAHRAGIVHRDIKPSNVFLVEPKDARSYLKLLDFGIAKVSGMEAGTTPQTRASAVIGTPEYIAPEQAQGKAVSPRTDLYAVGCMAFELLTGRLPFRGENPLETMFKHVTEPTPRVSVSHELPPELDELVFNLMAKSPELRPHSALQVIDLLEKLKPGLPVSQPSAPRPVLATDEHHAFAPTYVSGPVPPMVLTSGQVPTQTAAQPGPPAVPPAPPVSMPFPRERLSPWIYATVAVVVATAAAVVARPYIQPPPPVRELALTPVVKPVSIAAPVEPPKEITPEPAIKPAPKPPHAPAVSAEQISQRIAHLEERLSSSSLAPDSKRTLAGLLGQARLQGESAGSAVERKEVWELLDDVEVQLKR